MSHLDARLKDFVKTPQATCHLLKDDGLIPNNEKLPLLVYQNAVALPEDDPAAIFEAVFAANGWSGSWRNGIYSFPHYHSQAHEVLGIASGTAKVQFGGEKGVILTVKPGDVVVIPAGVGHKNLGASRDLCVVGAYPRGQTPDLRYGKPNERPEVIQNIARVPPPTLDPVYGANGPLIEYWVKRD
jgi:uncharacterized protein YjlB